MEDILPTGPTGGKCELINTEQPSARNDMFVPHLPYPLGEKTLRVVFPTISQSSLYVNLQPPSEVAGFICAVKTPSLWRLPPLSLFPALSKSTSWTWIIVSESVSRGTQIQREKIGRGRGHCFMRRTKTSVVTHSPAPSFTCSSVVF